MMVRILVVAAFFATKNDSDSGIFQIMNGNNTKGNTPPSKMTLRQPNAGIIHAATKPPAAAPKEKPQYAKVTKKARRRSGAYSADNVAALGAAAPKPKPVKKR